jgi:hypothetical protein
MQDELLAALFRQKLAEWEAKHPTGAPHDNCGCDDCWPPRLTHILKMQGWKSEDGRMEYVGR